MHGKAAVVILTLLASSPSISQAGTESFQTIHLLHFSDLEGSLSPLTCSREGRGGVNFASYVQLVLDQKNSAPSFLFSSGNVLGDSPFVEFLLSQGESGWVTLASALRQGEPVMFVPGLAEFTLPARMFLELLPEFDRLGLAWRAANISCVDAREACGLLTKDPIVVHVVEGVRFALIPLVGSQLPSVVSPENVEGLKFEDPVKKGNELAQRARKELRADIVVAVVNLEIRHASTVATIDFAQRVQGVDIVVAGGMVSERGDEPAVTLAHMGTSRPLLVGSPRAPAGLGVLSLRLKKKGTRWVIDDASAVTKSPSSFRRHAETGAAVAQVVSEFCSLTSRYLGRGKVEPPMTRLDFVKYVMEIMRRHFRTDLSIFSMESLKVDPSISLSGSVDAGFLYKAFARHQVVILEVSGQDLNSFLTWWLDPSTASLCEELVILGASRDPDETIKVNDRPINIKRRYSIATTDFLAAGAKGYLDMLLSSPFTTKRETSWFLRELVQRFFERNKFALEEGDTIIALDRNFVSLWNRPLWEFAWSVTGSGTNVTVSNPSDYEETQLARAGFTGIKTEAQMYVNVSSKDHRCSDFTKIQYGRAKTGKAEAAETQDLITQELLYSWTRLRNLSGEERAYIPVPVAKGKVETEFTRAENARFHHLELTGVAGIEWMFSPNISSGLAYGVRRELLDKEGELHPGIQFYYQVNSVPLYTWGVSGNILLDSRFELFYSDWAGSDTLKGIGGTKLTATLIGPLSFAAGFDLFLFRTGSGELAWSIDSTAGLSLTFETAVQQY